MLHTKYLNSWPYTFRQDLKRFTIQVYENQVNLRVGLILTPKSW